MSGFFSDTGDSSVCPSEPPARCAGMLAVLFFAGFCLCKTAWNVSNGRKAVWENGGARSLTVGEWADIAEIGVVRAGDLSLEYSFGVVRLDPLRKCGFCAAADHFGHRAAGAGRAVESGRGVDAGCLCLLQPGGRQQSGFLRLGLGRSPLESDLHQRAYRHGHALLAHHARIVDFPRTSACPDRCDARGDDAGHSGGHIQGRNRSSFRGRGRGWFHSGRGSTGGDLALLRRGARRRLLAAHDRCLCALDCPCGTPLAARRPVALGALVATNGQTDDRASNRVPACTLVTWGHALTPATRGLCTGGPVEWVPGAPCAAWAPSSVRCRNKETAS